MNERLELTVSERHHSNWGGSSAYRWARCPMSVAMTLANQDKDTDTKKVVSDAMLKGTAVHRLCEWILANAPCTVPSTVTVHVREGGDTTSINLEHAEIENAVDYAHSVLGVMKSAPHAKLLVETELHLAPGVFGVADAVVLEPYLGEAHIFDYKNGERPVFFSEDGLDQAGFLATAAVKHFLPTRIKRVTFYYIQPNRRDGQGAVSVKIFEGKELRGLKKTFLAAVEKSRQPSPEGYGTGDHCADCAHHKDCPEYPKMAAKAAAIQFAAPEPQKISALIAEKGAIANVSVKDILAMKTRLIKWFEAFEDAVTTEALATGSAPEGMKLVQGRAGKRTWRLDDKETGVSLVQRGVPSEVLFSTELKSPAQIEKAVKGIDLSDLVIQKDGKPVLAPLDDPRPGLCVNEFTAIAANKTE